MLQQTFGLLGHHIQCLSSMGFAFGWHRHTIDAEGAHVPIARCDCIEHGDVLEALGLLDGLIESRDLLLEPIHLGGEGSPGPTVVIASPLMELLVERAAVRSSTLQGCSLQPSRRWMPWPGGTSASPCGGEMWQGVGGSRCWMGVEHWRRYEQ